MNVSGTPATAPRPRVIPSIVAGFDTITKHIYLILFPVAFDFLLWLGPHLRVNQIIQSMRSNLVELSELDTPQLSEMVEQSLEVWELIGERFNVMVALRSFPVGVPALFTSALPVDSPFIEPALVEITNVLVLMALIGLFTIFGVFFGTIYFLLVSDAALDREIRLSEMIRDIPFLGLRSLLVTLTWLFILIVVSIPVMCVSSIALLMGPALGQVALLVFIGILVWIFFPLIFSSHGIFVNRQNVWLSIREGARLTNLTLPTTGSFILLAVLISQGLKIVWSIPPEDSPLAIISVFGHAFVATGLLCASFIYYQQAKNWIDHALSDKRLNNNHVSE